MKAGCTTLRQMIKKNHLPDKDSRDEEMRAHVPHQVPVSVVGANMHYTSCYKMISIVGRAPERADGIANVLLQNHLKDDV